MEYSTIEKTCASKVLMHYLECLAFIRRFKWWKGTLSQQAYVTVN